jgi:hypothetical protein
LKLFYFAYYNKLLTFNLKFIFMLELLDQLEQVLADTREDAVKFDEKGNKAAGTRVRKAMQTIKGLAQDVRVAVSATKNA